MPARRWRPRLVRRWLERLRSLSLSLSLYLSLRVSGGSSGPAAPPRAQTRTRGSRGVVSPPQFYYGGLGCSTDLPPNRNEVPTGRAVTVGT